MTAGRKKPALSFPYISDAPSVKAVGRNLCAFGMTETAYEPSTEPPTPRRTPELVFARVENKTVRDIANIPKSQKNAAERERFLATELSQ